MGAAVIVVATLTCAFATAAVAHRKGRSAWWWFLGGLIGGLPALILAAVETRAGEPQRFRSPIALLLFALVYGGFFVLLVVIAEIVG